VVAALGRHSVYPACVFIGSCSEQLPAATAYAAFTGIATAGTAIVGMAFFGESANLGRVSSLVLIVIGLIGLKLFSSASGSCVHQIEMSLFVPFRNVTVGWGRTAGERGALA
jgi:hypothetical protein